MNIPKLIVLLSGPVAVGKTTLRQTLVSEHAFDYVRSGAYLVELATKRGLSGSRSTLQELGDSLDLLTNYHWLLDDVARPQFDSKPSTERWLVDAVRKMEQVQHFRDAYGSVVAHVHLNAPEDVLKNRYEKRARSSGPINATPYEVAITHQNEIASRSLIRIADLVLDMVNIDSSTLANTVMNRFRT